MRHVISVQDFSAEEIIDILDRAETMVDIARGEAVSEVLKGKVLAAIFFEPSTRTRLSFETAMNRLGGGVIGDLGGLGAISAVLMLVFKDTILSLVASVQLNALDMVHVGDWIEVPQFGADGDVIDVQLHTIKVQNWDKTITTIPTHRLISDSFKNWRGMSQAGGRRIKRSIYLDASSVHFLSQEEIEHCRRFALLEDYLSGKDSELAAYNGKLSGQNADAEVNQRRLTNVGTFRAYTYQYLKQHPCIHRGMTLLVRQLPPGPQGIPIEIYCFTNTTVWNDYEGIQADIFDHILAVIPEFGLRVYQQPSGADFQSLTATP